MKALASYRETLLRLTVKLGGSILEDAGTRSHIIDQIVAARNQGHEIILVHGGGKRLNRRLSQLGLTSRFINGLRVTDEATLQVALMVLAGEVNKTLVLEIAKGGAAALGISGADGAAVRCLPLSSESHAAENLGFVGKPTRINKDLFEAILASGTIPVVCSIALGEDFHFYNVNADQMAAICAWAAGSQALVYLTDVGGVLNELGEVIRRMDPREIKSMRERGILTGGMLPKTASCLEALERGVGSVCILPGASPEILLQFIHGDLIEGTCIHGI